MIARSAEPETEDTLVRIVTGTLLGNLCIAGTLDTGLKPEDQVAWNSDVGLFRYADMPRAVRDRTGVFGYYVADKRYEASHPGWFKCVYYRNEVQ